MQKRPIVDILLVSPIFSENCSLCFLHEPEFFHPSCSILFLIPCIQLLLRPTLPDGLNARRPKLSFGKASAPMARPDHANPIFKDFIFLLKSYDKNLGLGILFSNCLS